LSARDLLRNSLALVLERTNNPLFGGLFVFERFRRRQSLSETRDLLRPAVATMFASPFL
jgi:hypothetical protein